MVETKIKTLYSDNFNREETVINEYACFGWQYAMRSTETDGYGNLKSVKLTFQRETDNYPNLNVLNQYFNAYCNEEYKIYEESEKVKISNKSMTITTIIGMLLLSCLFFFVLLPWWDLFSYSDEIGMKILFSVLAGMGTGSLFVLAPMAIISDSRVDKTKRKIKPEVYGNMRNIAIASSKYLPRR